jgi:hypothetical protein
MAHFYRIFQDYVHMNVPNWHKNPAAKDMYVPKELLPIGKRNDADELVNLDKYRNYLQTWVNVS